MFSKLRNHFGIPGIISVIALVFAMLGGAYAASGPAGGGATTSAKAKQGPPGKRGKPGKPGPAGPTGPVGPKGDTGAPGANGAVGAAGKEGSAGKNGTSVKVTPIELEEAECEGRGGAMVEEDGVPTSAAEVCSGEEGSPWTAGGTLPKNATQTGAWSFNASKADSNEFTEQISVPISFPIKLVAGLDSEHVHFAGEAEFSTTCKGNLENPAAPSGHLCVYGGNEEFGSLGNATFQVITSLGLSTLKEANAAGAVMLFTITADHAFGNGSWAVTG